MHLSNGIRIRLFAAAAALALGAAPAAGALAAQAVSFAHSVTPFDETVQVVGKADPQAVVHFQIALPLRDYDGLVAGNHAGRKLAFTQLEQRHLPTKGDYDKVLNWLTRHGLSVDATPSSRLTIEASGPAATVSRLLGVQFAHVKSEGQDFVSAQTAPQVPVEIAGLVLSVNGLQPHVRAHPMHVIQPLSATAPAYWPQAFITGYSASGLGDGGAGTTTAIVIDTFPKAKDLKLFWSTTGIPQTMNNITFIQAVAGVLPAPSGEESMDVETVSGVAPKSKVRVYASQSLSFANLDTAYQRVISDIQGGQHITQVSISLGACESAVSSGERNTEDGLFATMNALGATVFVSTGDSGSRECGKKKGNVPSFPSTSPNVTAAGGTALTLNGSGVTTSETGWSGSGGGISVAFASPSWQSGLGFAHRAVPDISADADPNTGALVVLNGTNHQIGGTSLSAPLLAGLTALVNNARATAGKGPVGELNHRLYGLPAANFRDITSGSNFGYTAVAGYDLVTGIGAPVMSTLLPTLVAQP